MKLKLHSSYNLAYSKPFSFEKTFHIPSHFPSKLELFDNDKYYMTINFKGERLGLKFQMKKNNLRLYVYTNTILKNEYISDLLIELDHRFTLANKNYADFYDKYKDDRFLSPVVEKNYGKHLSTMYSLYEGLIISTLLQNVTVQRTIKMCENLLSKYGEIVEFDGVELYCFWTVQEFNPSEDDLRALKVGYRAKNIVRITEHFKSNSIPDLQLRAMSTPILVKELLKIYGVGKQTVFYLVSGQFHRTEYLRHIPLWERKILSRYIFDKELVEETELVK